MKLYYDFRTNRYVDESDLRFIGGSQHPSILTIEKFFHEIQHDERCECGEFPHLDSEVEIEEIRPRRFFPIMVHYLKCACGKKERYGSRPCLYMEAMAHDPKLRKYYKIPPGANIPTPL